MEKVPLTRITTFRSLMDSLGTAIVSGEFGTSGTLPSEADLAKRYAISRNAVREAIKGLVSKGMLGTRARTGIYLLPPERWNTLDVDVIRWRGKRLDTMTFLGEIYEMRLMLEPEISAAAAIKITNEETVELQSLFDEMVREADRNDLNAFIEADNRFHAYIFEVARNPMLHQVRNIIEAVVDSAWITESFKLPWYLDEHRAILSAIVEHDPARARIATREFLFICVNSIGLKSVLKF